MGALNMNDWISVKEKLPVEDGVYLVATRLGWIEDRVHIYWFEKRRFNCHEQVTHWMPLPPAPEEVKPDA